MGVFRKLREHTKIFMKGIMLPIKAGPLKGMKWSISSGFHFIKGHYEEFKTKSFISCIKPGDVIYDIGGHVGYYSILSSVLTGPTGKVFIFEPRPLNITFLKGHLKKNKIKNVSLIEAALSNEKGQRSFDENTGSGTGHLATHGNLEVPTISLDEFVEEKALPAPNFLKMDIEGGETKALEGARKTIEKSRPTLLIATHGKKEHAFVLKYLSGYNYHYKVLNPNAIKGDTEIIALPLEKKLS